MTSTHTLNRALPSRNPELVVDGRIQRRPVVVLLRGGPCDGTHARVLGFGRMCWQRVEGDGAPYWARYDKNLLVRGEYVFAGEVITLVEMAEKIARLGRGNVTGSHGA